MSYQQSQRFPHGQQTQYKTSAERMSDFQKFVRRYESKPTMILSKVNADPTNLLVNNEFATKLRGLEGYEIVFVCDDSGSMNTPLGQLNGVF